MYSVAFDWRMCGWRDGREGQKEEKIPVIQSMLKTLSLISHKFLIKDVNMAEIREEGTSHQ